jgi:hypothetical protein
LSQFEQFHNLDIKIELEKEFYIVLKRKSKFYASCNIATCKNDSLPQESKIPKVGLPTYSAFQKARVL